MAHADFVSGDALRVHTRWIETDLAREWQAEPGLRPEPHGAQGFQRTVIEIDGRRVNLGLPASLLAGLTTTQAAVAGSVPARASEPAEPEDSAAVTAPAAGNLSTWKVAEGAVVQAGDLIAVMEAMKMEMQVHAHRAGSIRLLARKGELQVAGAVLARIE